MEARKGTERRAGPLPSVADEIVDAPRAPPGRRAARRLWIPAREIEHAVRRGRCLLAPWVRAFRAPWGTVGGALNLGLGRKAAAPPSRVRLRFSLADVDGPGERQRDHREHSSPVPSAFLAGPEKRMTEVFRSNPLPVSGIPPPLVAVTPGFDELEKAFV